MIAFNEFQKVMAFNLKSRFCIEILFALNGSEKFNYCWMGKMPDRSTGEDVYWFGLTKDGKTLTVTRLLKKWLRQKFLTVKHYRRFGISYQF